MVGVSNPRKRDRRLTFWNIWLGWIAANAAFWAIGFGLAQVYARALYGNDRFIRQVLEGANYIWTRPLGSLVATTNYGLMLGAAIGLGQWLVLRRRLAIEWLWWLAATMLGFALHGMSLGLSAGLASGDQVTAAGLGLLCGGVILAGIPQWLVLRQHLPRAGWWIVASAVGLLLAIPGRSGGTNSLMAWLFVSLGAGAAFGIVTAFFLFFMMPAKAPGEENVEET
jgi:hypothetical protein